MFKRKKKITLKVEIVYGLFSNKSNPNQTATLMFAHSSQGKTLVCASFVHQMLPRKVVKFKFVSLEVKFMQIAENNKDDVQEAPELVDHRPRLHVRALLQR